MDNKDLNKSDHSSDSDGGAEKHDHGKPAAHKGRRPPPPVAPTKPHEKIAEGLPPVSGRDKSAVEEIKGGEEPYRERPIQLVKIDHDLGRFRACEQGMRILQGLEGNIGIVAFTGLYRTGKSFTLNLLLDKLGKGVRRGYSRP